MSNYDFELDMSTRNSLSLIISRITKNSTILEFGPANGRMTKHLKETLGCTVYAVELDDESAKGAAEFCEDILVGDIEKFTWLTKYQDIKFDYIIFADVLEHLYNPETVLTKAKTLLKNEGSILMSLPNIAHNAIIMDLLNDKFTYRKTGLLDSTHIRFFTKNTLEELIENSGLQIAFETASYAAPPNTEFKNNYADLDRSVALLLSGREFGEAYQFVFEAKNNVTNFKTDFFQEDVASLYVDTGNGFNELEKLATIFNSQSDNVINFTLDTDVHNVKAIRIDPLEMALSLKVENIIVNATDETNKLKHNGVTIGNNELKFLDNDPQLLIDFDESVILKNVAVKYEYLTKNHTEKIELQAQVVKDQAQQIQEKDTHIESQARQIQEKDTHIENQAQQIQSLRLKNRIKRLLRWKAFKHVKNNPRSIKLGLSVLKNHGVKELIQKIKQVNMLPTTSIDNTYKYIEPELSDEIKNEIEGFTKKPLISIIMPVYNVDPKWLDLAIKSIEKQWYENWELCIVDDKSTNKKTVNYIKAINSTKIKVKELKQNRNISIASNEALSLTLGEYIALMDNDDELTPDALYEVVKVINEFGAEFIYSDEDKIEMDGTFSDPHFKPDFAPDMFLSQNYLSHLGVIKKELIDKVKGFTAGLEGAQDYDLYLKVLEHTNKIHHIQKVLYHWRKIPGSTAAEFGEKSYAQEAGRQSLENAIKRRKIDGSVENGITAGTYKVSYTIIGEPLVSIIIPFKDKPKLLTLCVESILDKTTYQNWEIIGISNNSEEKATFTEMKRLQTLDNRIHFHEYNIPFNYSAINNFAVTEYAKGEHVLLLNNDIEIITPEWIEELLMHSQRSDVGAVGAKLYFPNNTIQHTGLVIAPYTDHAILSMYRGAEKEEYGYVSRAKCINNYSAVTAALLMCEKNIFEKVGGFDSEKLTISYNDVDLCLRLYESGYFNVFTPYCEAYHHESISRGYENSLDQIERREKEKIILKEKHSFIFGSWDPFYNKNLTLLSDKSKISSEVSSSYLEFVGRPWSEKRIIEIELKKKQKNRVCIFSHYDKTGEISDYVIFYLEELSKIADIVFISTADKMTEQEIEKIKRLCRYVVVKENYGYDFGAWKSGLLILGDEVNAYDQLIFCNDSVFGPFNKLEPIFDEMNEKYDVWSMTDSVQIGEHLQSYFIVYNKKAFQHEIFNGFWDSFKIYSNKQKLIEMNEVRFSEELKKSELKIGAYCATDNYSHLNITHYYWNDLVLNRQFPFIKKELLRDNPMNIDISNWKSTIKLVSKYDVDLIISGLK